MIITGNKQKLLLEYLVSSADTFAVCRSIIQSTYFNPEYRKVVAFLQDYYTKYNNTPNTNQIFAETGIQLDAPIITRDQISYCSDEIEQFCKVKALELAVIESAALIGTDKQDQIEQLIKNAVQVSLDADLGVDYFADPEARLTEFAKTPPRISTGWTEVDDAMGGGLALTEMLLLAANSGGGKSISLANLAVNMSNQGIEVLYLTLEMSEQLVSQRFDTMFTGVSSVNWDHHIPKIVDGVVKLKGTNGKITIKRMPIGTNANAIRAYLKEYELKNKSLPTLLIVDYLDLMSPNEKVSADNVSEKDKRSTEQLRDILLDYNMMGATASQLNRQAVEAESLNHSHIAGGLTKVNTVDWMIYIVMTPPMKAAGDMMWIFTKSRSSDAVGQTVDLVWDNKNLRILNQPASKTQKLVESVPVLVPGKRKSLADLI